LSNLNRTCIEETSKKVQRNEFDGVEVDE